MKRKQIKIKNIVYKDSGITCSEEPTVHLVIGNVGIASGVLINHVLEKCRQFGEVDKVVMVTGRTYCFVSFQNTESSQKAYSALHGQRNTLHEEDSNGPEMLYVAFANTVPELKLGEWNVLPNGGKLLKDYISEEEEKSLINCIEWQETTGQSLKHRMVQHYGYEFQYHNNNINKDTPLERKIPEECNFLFDRLKAEGYITSSPDQLTVNHYLPGQGIPPHIDTHSACGETIVSLSLLSTVVMDFRNKDGRHYPVVLPSRSLLILSGEARYAWTHGIIPHYTDVLPCDNEGLTVQIRETRISFTFRWVRKTKCDCSFHEQCDSFQKSYPSFNKDSSVLENEEVAAELEKSYVLQIYENIAAHFSETRHKPWPNILTFVQNLPVGSVLVDVGCGNGKYFGYNKNILEIGCDSSWNLAKVCRDRCFEVCRANCLILPFEDNCADACICIAVIHHLVTKQRRVKAVEEIIRVLRPGGEALIYVWAKNQEENNEQSSYLKQKKKKCKPKGNIHVDTLESERNSIVYDDSIISKSETPSNSNTVHDTHECVSTSPGVNLPVHKNRTQFQHQDILVPWKLKSDAKDVEQNSEEVYYRFYHVFQKGELEAMCQLVTSLNIVKSYYDQGNWCVHIKKTL